MSGGLPTPIRRVLNDASDDVTLERVWRRVAETRSGDAMRLERPHPLRWTLAAGGLAAAVAVAVGVWGFSRPLPAEAGPLRLASGQEIDSATLQSQASLRHLALSDGSSLEIAPGTAMDLLENDGHQFNLLLVRGKTTFEVRPGGPRRWDIEAGLASVEVVGTHFIVERTSARVHVEVQRGTVLVRSDFLPERVRKLTLAQSIDIDDPSAEKAPAAQSADQPKPAALPKPVEEAKPVLERSTGHRHAAPHVAQTATKPATAAAPAPEIEPTPSPVEWKTLAKEGAYSSAYNTLGLTGVVKETARAPRAEDLFALADIARYSGHPASAVGPLEEIVLHHREEPIAAQAAFTLGKIQLESLNDPKRAAEAFAQAVELQPPRGLLEPAYARLVESRAKAGDEAGAHAAAAEYVKRFPEGQFRNEMDAWLPRK
jgi:transmembrane sensor